MKRSALLEHFLTRKEEAERKAAPQPFVTISEQVGAGGHALGQALIVEMESRPGEPLWTDWQLLDHQLCEQIVSDPEIHVSLEELLQERYHSQVRELINDLKGDPQTPQLVVHRRMFEIMRTTAAFGKVIIVGRGAGLATREEPLGIHVRLEASVETRTTRTMAYHHLKREEAVRFMKKVDHERARMVKDYFSKDISDRLIYHMTCNTDLLGIEDIVPLVMTLVEQKAAEAARRRH